MLTSVSDSGWTRENVKFRNTERPSLTSDYSILGVVDKITKMERFQVKGCNACKGPQKVFRDLPYLKAEIRDFKAK